MIDSNNMSDKMIHRSDKIIVIKYGGNAMVNDEVKNSVISNIKDIYEAGYNPVIVHGGGPFIKSILEKVKIESEFIGGHRKTSKEAIKYIEMSLKGEVNTGIVTMLNKMGRKAVGLSGKDAGMAMAKRRYHIDGSKKIDLGMVGDIEKINPEIIHNLIEKGYTPVIACVAADTEGNTYNVNADMMAGAIAGAIAAEEYIVLTDIDGLRKDPEDASTLMESLVLNDLSALYGTSIQGGMIPKIESCEIAVKSGAKHARIINGTKKDILKNVVLNKMVTGTKINK